MKNAKEFLDLCTRRFPPPRPDLRHSLTLEGDTMVLTLIQGYDHVKFNVNDRDLSKPPALLLTELIVLLKAMPDKKSSSDNGPKPA